MLERLRPTGDRIVIVSNYTQTLDLFSQLCRDRGVRPAPATSLFVILKHRISRFMYIQYESEAGPVQIGCGKRGCSYTGCTAAFAVHIRATRRLAGPLQPAHPQLQGAALRTCLLSSVTTKLATTCDTYIVICVYDTYTQKL